MREIEKLDAMLNEAQEAAGVGSHAELLEWIRVRKAEDWQPIATAPKEVYVLAWDDYPFVARTCDGEWWDGGSLMHPTHWRPLPEGPIKFRRRRAAEALQFAP